MMRIITGSARGAKLIAPAGELTRPTAERTKEAVFSMLQNELADRRVLDLFGGSGQMGLEALSRGAAHAVFVDHERSAIDAITKNAAHTRLSHKAEILRADSVGFLRSYRGAPFHLIFLDPPYAGGIVPQCLALIAEKKMLLAGGIIVCETGDPDAVFADNTALQVQYTVLRRSRYGVAHICLLTPSESAETEGTL